MHSLFGTISEVAINLHPDIAEMLANRISLLNDISDYERAINNLGPAISKESIDKLKRSWQKFPEIKRFQGIYIFLAINVLWRFTLLKNSFFILRLMIQLNQILYSRLFVD